MNVRNSSKVVSDTADFLWVPDIACRNINICTQESYNQTATKKKKKKSRTRTNAAKAVFDLHCVQVSSYSAFWQKVTFSF